MASLRNLKKDVNNLCYSVIDECLSFLAYSPSLNQENVQIIISDAVELRNKLIYQINNPDISNRKGSSKRVYFLKLREELFDETITLVERLNNLPR